MSTKNKLRKRKCSNCGTILYHDSVSHDMSHNLCYSCWKKENSKKNFHLNNTRSGRYCINCGKSLTGDSVSHPKSHDLCYRCWKEENMY